MNIEHSSIASNLEFKIEHIMRNIKHDYSTNNNYNPFGAHNLLYQFIANSKARRRILHVNKALGLFYFVRPYSLVHHTHTHIPKVCVHTLHNNHAIYKEVIEDF